MYIKKQEANELFKNDQLDETHYSSCQVDKFENDIKQLKVKCDQLEVNNIN